MEVFKTSIDPKYLKPSPVREGAMQALVGIRTTDRTSKDSTEVIRRMREGTRLSRLTNQNSK
jgi:hypothetical protein